MIWQPLAELARDYALAGRAAEARQALADLLTSAKRHYVSKYEIATVYAAMNDGTRLWLNWSRRIRIVRSGWLS
jgi:hypothetical protein